MRADRHGCERYLQRVAELMERFGVELDEPAPGADFLLLEDDLGRLSFRLSGVIGGPLDGARLDVREELAPGADGEQFATSRYAYELIDTVREYRRAFHLHDPEWFRQHYLVLVHEHCEQPLGRAVCDHHVGNPVRDAYAGVTALVGAWMADPLDCRDLPCLE